MKHITARMVADALNRLGPRFNTHQVEKSLLRWCGAETGREIAGKWRARYPLRAFSAELGKYIDRRFRGQLRKTSKVVDPTLRGTLSDCQEWEKLNTPIVP